MLPLLWCCFAHLLILEYPDHHQNLISSSLYYPGPLHKISSQFAYNFLSNVVHRQTDKQTNQRSQKHQSINQSILFLIKRYIINALSAVQWNTHKLVWTHTYTYTVKYSTHTSIHTRQPFRRRYNVFISFTHTLTLVDVASGPYLPYSW